MKIDVPAFAYDLACSAVPHPFTVPSPLGGFDVKIQGPVGGHALLDMYACALASGTALRLLAAMDVDDEEELDALVMGIWRVAASMARTRPQRDVPPDSDGDARPRPTPRLLVPGGVR